MADVRSELASESKNYELLLCAAALIRPEVVFEKCLTIVNERHFYYHPYRLFWREFSTSMDVNAAAFASGEEMEILSASANMGFAIPVEQIAQKVAELSYMRDALELASAVVRGVSGRDAATIKVLVGEFASRDYLDVSNVMDASEIDYRFREYALDITRSSIKTGLKGLDDIIGGFFGGDLIVVAARPSMGKTAFCLQIAKNIARSGRRVLFVSLEMGVEQLWARIVCPSADVSWADIRLGVADQGDLQKVEMESVYVGDALKNNLFVSETAYTIDEIQALCYKLRPDILFVDQLPEIRWHNPDETELVWYGKVCKILRQNIARRLQIPVVLVHQLSRNLENRQEKRPFLADLRSSGEVEQRSDLVIMLHREDYYSQTYHPLVADLEVLVRKNRQGDTGSCVLTYDMVKQEIT